MFLYANNAIKKSPCRHFLFCLDIFVEILKFTRYIFTISDPVSCKRKRICKTCQHLSGSFSSSLLLWLLYIFQYPPNTPLYDQYATPHRHKNVVLIVALKQQAIYIHHQYMQISFYPKQIKSYQEIVYQRCRQIYTWD